MFKAPGVIGKVCNQELKLWNYPKIVLCYLFSKSYFGRVNVNGEDNIFVLFITLDTI